MDGEGGGGLSPSDWRDQTRNRNLPFSVENILAPGRFCKLEDDDLDDDDEGIISL